MIERYEEVEGIPSGILTCFIDDKEVGVTKCSPTSVTVRVADAIQQIKKIEIAGYCFQENLYHHILIKEWFVAESEERDYCWYYTYEIRDEEYASEIRRIQKEYMSYIRYKMEYEDNEVSEKMVGYPSAQDAMIPTSYKDIVKGWLIEDHWNDFLEKKKSLLKEYDIEIAVCLDTHERYANYINNGKEGVKRKEMPDFIYERFGRLYIGNQFCPNLLPERKVLFQIMDKAYREGLTVTLCLSYLRDDRISKMQALLEELADWCRREGREIELIINDIGYLKLLETYQDVLHPVLGILLNKRRKDARYEYKKGFLNKSEKFMENAWNSEVLTAFAKKYGIGRYEYESCNYQMKLPTKHHSLHFPLYQTNTAAFCILHASYSYGDRGRQQLVNHCSYPCDKFVFAYPKHLKVIGKYNSLFAYDDSLMQKEGWLEGYLQQGIDRLVWNL